MGLFSCFKGKQAIRGLRERGEIPDVPNPRVLNEPTHPSTTNANHAPTTDPKTERRATSPAKELHATNLTDTSIRGKARRAPSPAKELHSEPVPHEEYLPRTPKERSLSPELTYSPPFVDSAIGTPEAEDKKHVTVRSFSSRLELSACLTVYNCSPTPTPKRTQSYVSLGTQTDDIPSPSLTKPFVLQGSQTHSASKEKAVPIVPEISKTHPQPEQYPASSFATVTPKTTPKVVDEAPWEPDATLFSSLHPKPEPEVFKTQTLKTEPKVLNPTSTSSASAEPIVVKTESSTDASTFLFKAPDAPKTSDASAFFFKAPEAPQTFTFGAQSPKPFTFGTKSPQPTSGTQSSKPFDFSTTFGSSTRSSQPSSFGTQLSKPFDFSPKPSQSTQSSQQTSQSTQSSQNTQPLHSTQSSQTTQSSQPFGFLSKLPPTTQPSQPFNIHIKPSPTFPPSQPFNFNTKPEPTQPSQPVSFYLPTNLAPTRPPPEPVAPSLPPPPPPGTLCRCGAPNNFFRTKSGDNSGREYRKCSSNSCKSWNGFTDGRGLSGTNNGQCRCNKPATMRLVLNKAQYGAQGRTAFYSCQYKLCTAGGTYLDEWGENKVLREEEVRRMVRLGYV